MQLTSAEESVVRRAVAAYKDAKKPHGGPFTGQTADEILGELKPSPARWAELASFVIVVAEGRPRRKS